MVSKLLFRQFSHVAFIILGHFLVTKAKVVTEKIIRLGIPLPVTNRVSDTTNYDAVHRLTAAAETIAYLNRIYAKENITIQYSFFDTGEDSFTAGAQAGITLSKRMFNGRGLHGIIGGKLKYIIYMSIYVCSFTCIQT